jgi:gliding motility-associated-like protein
MKNKLLVLITFLLFISFSFFAQRKELFVNSNFPLPNKTEKPGGAIKFSGFIGKPGSPAVGEMKSSKSQEDVKKECTFFSSDSLQGFNFDEVAIQLDKGGYKLYLEFRNMMYRAQCDFIKNKFNLTNFPIVPLALQHAEPPAVLASSCANLDFEDGNFTNWVVSSGYNTNSNGNLTVPAAGAGTGITATDQNIYSCTDANIITAAYGTDPIGFPGLDPTGGSYSARVGGFSINTATGYSFGCDGFKWSSLYSNGEILEQTYAVTASNALISFDYAVVLNDGGHTNGNQPYFHVYVKNASTGVILSSCTQYYVQAAAGGPPAGFSNSGFVNSSDNTILYYKNWTSNSINLTPYIGQNVNIEFVAAGCTAGAHMAWAYVDVTCGPAVVIASNASPCPGQTVTLTAPNLVGGSYAWYGTGITGLTGQSVGVTTAGTYSVVVTPSQGAACTYTLTKTVTYNSAPVVTASATNPTICLNGSTILNGGGASTYVWTGGVTNGVSFNPTVTTTYTVTGTSALGCTNTAVQTITVNPIPVANAGAGGILTCSLPNITLSGSGGASYSWTGPGITGGGATANPTVNQPGTYSLIVTSAAGCTSTVSTVAVSQNTVVPVVTTTAAVLNCTATTVNATASTTTTPVTYNWSGTGISSATTFSTISVTQPGVFNYTVTNSSNGCKTTGNVTVTQNTVAPTVASAVSAVLNCTLTSVNASATTTSTPVSYNWSGPGITSAANISTVTINQPGTYNYTVTNPGNGCTTTGNVSATQNIVAPTVTSSVSAVLNCTLTTVNVSATSSTTPVSYAWSGTGITSASNISTITVNQPGTFNYTVTNTSNGCIATGSQTVAQSSGTPSVVGSVSAILTCATTTVQTIATTSTTPVSYTWTGPSVIAGATTASATVNQPGTYNYTVTNTSNGCKTSGSVVVSQNITPPIVTPSVSAVLNCTLTTVNASATTTTTPATYNWSGLGITSATTNSAITVNQPGTYNYTVTNSGNGCSTINSATVAQNIIHPAVTSTVSAVLNCTLASVNVSATTTTTPVSYAWSGTGITAGATTSTATVNQPGTFNYTITNTSNGCTTLGSQNVTQNITAPTVTATPSGSLNCTTTTVQTIATTTTTPVSYTWTGPSITAGAATASATVNQPGTYNYIVTDNSNGCTTSGGVAVIQNTVLPNANATTASIITCTNNIISLSSSPVSGVTYTWTAPAGSSILSSINAATISAQGAGVYTVTITDNSNNCVKAATVTPAVNTTTITPSITSTPVLTCASTTVTLNGAPTSGVLYGWSGPGTIAPVNLANVNINLPGSYVLTATNTANGCVGTVTTSITQNTVAPTVTVSPTQTITCASPSVSISGASSPSTCTPSWAGVCGSPTSFTTTACATGTFVLTVTNPINGCSNTGSVVVVSSNGLPSVTASNSGSITCSNSSVQVAATTTDSPVSFSWSGPGTITSVSSPTTNVNAGGTYTCVVTNTATGCASTISSFVPTNTTTVLAAIAPASSITCTSPTQTLSASPTGSQYAFGWTGGGIISGSVTANPEVNLGGNYVVTITNTITGCTGTSNVNVPQDNAAPTITINPSSYTTTCANPTATLVTNASSSTLTYSWTAPSSGALDNLTTANPVANGSGIFTVAVTNTVNGCSTALSQATVQVIQDMVTPTATLSSNSVSITCSNPTPSVSVSTSTSAVSYIWSPTSGIVSGTETTANPTFSLAGSYSVVVTNTVNSCASNTGYMVTVGKDTIIPNFSLSSSSPSNTGTLTCSIASINVTPTFTVPTSNLTYTWSSMPGFSTPANQASVTFTAAGVYTLAVTNTVTGCVSSTTLASSTYSVFVDTIKPIVAVIPTSTNTSIGCGPNTTVTFSANATATGTTVIYSWNPGGSASPSFTASTAGVYNVVVTDAVSSCSTTAQFTVTGNTITPNLSSNATGNFPCGASNTTLTASSTNTNVTYSWSGPIGAVITGSATNTPTIDMAGNYVVTVTDPTTGCTNSQTVAVVQTSITALFTADPTSGISPLTVNFTNQTIGATTYSWNLGNGSTSSATNPNTVYNAGGTYTIELLASSGSCSASYSTTIVVEDGLSLVIPNVFTPNGDGINDVFSITATGIKEISLSIFNRWGLKLYEFTGPKAAWDGIISGNGAKASDGTYFFFVKATGYDDKLIEKNGTVNLFR